MPWILREGAAETARRFWTDWKALPKPARHTWLITLTIGWAAAMALMLLMTWSVAALDEAGRLGFDAVLLIRLAELAPFNFSYAIWIETPGNAIFLVPLTVTAAYVAARTRQPLVALSLLASFFMMAVVVILGWSTWDRPRPEIIEGDLGSTGFSSFPSGHMAQLISAFGMLIYLWVRRSPSVLEKLFGWLLLAVLATTVGMTRLVLGSHWPTDIVAGTLIGVVWLGAMIVSLRRAEAQMTG